MVIDANVSLLHSILAYVNVINRTVDRIMMKRFKYLFLFGKFRVISHYISFGFLTLLKEGNFNDCG